MKSLILTILYLSKDTLHRWFSRISSPLARILVVYFLTLCALASLGSHVISAKIVQDKIVRKGGNIVGAMLTSPIDTASFVPSREELQQTLGADSYVLRYIGQGRLAGGQHINIYTCSFSRLRQVLPYMAPGGGPTLIQGEHSGTLPPGPADLTIGDTTITVFVRNLEQDHPLLRTLSLNESRGVIFQQESLPQELRNSRGVTNVISLIVNNLESSEPIRRAYEFLQTYKKLEGLRSSIIVSALDLLQEMDSVLSKQTKSRIAFCVGISSIVGILLTALAGMEYRQNEYIYTLMKSFGIHPLLLIGAFITENLIIVGASFVGAIATFIYFQRIIITQILKLGSYTLTLDEITPEIVLISYTLLGCILFSTLPIIAATHRAIGRVLK